MSAYKQRVLQALQHCSQERLDAAMENPSMMKELLELFGHELQFPFDSPTDLQNVAGGRAKRPLNAFMAFRSKPKEHPMQEEMLTSPSLLSEAFP